MRLSQSLQLNTIKPGAVGEGGSGPQLPPLPASVYFDWDMRYGVTLVGDKVDSVECQITGTLLYALNGINRPDYNDGSNDADGIPYALFVRTVPNALYTPNGYNIFRDQGCLFIWNNTSIGLSSNANLISGNSTNNPRIRAANDLNTEMRWGGSTTREFGPHQSGKSWIISQAEEGNSYICHYNSKTGQSLVFSSAQTIANTELVVGPIVHQVSAMVLT